MHAVDDSSAQPDETLDAFASRVHANQQQLAAELKPYYDFIVCGSGSSGSVVARRLAESPEVSVLLLEAGGHDEATAVTDAACWPANLGSERDWGFRTRPSPHLNGRSLAWSMGKVLGGGSSINLMIWSRGHQNDWDHFAAETGDPAWSYDSVLEIYRRIEDWQGEPDPARRGTGGLVFVQPVPDPNPIAPAMLEAARSVGIPTFADQNGAMMEGEGGCALANVRIRDGKRLSIFRTYVYPYLDRPNLTVLTGALVTRVLFEGKRAVAVEVVFEGKARSIGAGREVVLSLGAINTPKVLMQSGVGDEEELRRFGIDVVQHLPGVGRNLQDHALLASCVWEYKQPLPPRNNGAEATFFWKSDPSVDTPDLQPFQVEFPYVSPETARLNPPASSWSIAPGVVRPRSQGRLRLTGASPSDPVDIDANILGDPADMKAMLICVQLCREIGNSAALRPFTKREIMPGDLRGSALEHFVRDGIVTYWHQTCSAKMGRDPVSVVDGQLRVYGIENLRVADGSVMPRVTTGNTMAPCVIIGERAAEMIRRRHGL
ncbi:GMC family oxidoreductase [Sorangium sp. So ce1128]